MQVKNQTKGNSKSTFTKRDVLQQAGLVLEGGGTRGVFTAGVLDYLLDAQIYFPYAVGVSAGACHGLSYMSRQRERARKSTLDIMYTHPYVGLRFWRKQRSLLDLDLLYNVLPKKIYPYDYETYFNNPATYEIVTTNCLTGEPNYMTDKESEDRILTLARATSSLPFICPMCEVDGIPMLDGGISDSIPLQRAIDMGHTFNIVVLTRNKGYRSNSSFYKRTAFAYKKYPALRRTLERRREMYNEQITFVEEQERLGRALVIRPERPLEVGRLCSDPEKMMRLYKEGYEVAKRTFEQFLAEA